MDTPMPGGAVLTDVYVVALSPSSPSPSALLGFASGELGVLIKLNTSSPSAGSWTFALDTGDVYPYGTAVFPDLATVLVAGFVDGGGDSKGYLQYSRDGGATFEPRAEFVSMDWLSGPVTLFPDGKHGIVEAVGSGNIYVTASGGKSASDWSPVLPDPQQAWHAGDYLSNSSGYVKMVGASDCTSSTFGQSWVSPCAPSVDPDADGGIACASSHCIIGGGEIDPDVAGWVHLSSDGGATWSMRNLSAPFPIRTVEAIERRGGGPAQLPPLLVAAGGNYFSAVGGIFSSADGGATWVQDLDTQGEEVKACRGVGVGAATFRLFCVTAGHARASVFYADVHGASSAL
jgi:hypothetical protein